MILENWKMHENCNISSNLVLEINQKKYVVPCPSPFSGKYFSHYPHKKQTNVQPMFK